MANKRLVCVFFNALGTNPDAQTLLWCGRILNGLGPSQYDAQLETTTVGKLVADGMLDEETAQGMSHDKAAYLFDTAGNSADGEGVTAVLVEADLG